MLLVLVLVSAPAVARADAMGGIIYLLAIWPLGGLLGLSLLILGIIALVKIAGKKYTGRTRSLGNLVLGMAIGAGLIFPLLVIGLDKGFDADAGEAMYYSMLPVLIPAVACVILGSILIRRSTATS